MLFLGKFNKLVKVEALKCANRAFMRSNSLNQSRLTQINGIGKGAGDTNDSVIEENNANEKIHHGRQTIDPINLDQVNTKELYSTLCALSILEAYSNHTEARSSSRKKSGLKYMGFKLKSLPFGDAYGPLSNSIALQPFNVRIQQRAQEHQSANMPSSPFYNSKRFEYEHTERTNVGFLCPMQSRSTRKKEDKKDLYRKVDCTSLKEAGAIAAVLPTDKPKRFGCKQVKKPVVNRKPNACGVIFECPKKVVEPPKKGDCAVSEKLLDKSEITPSENQSPVTVLIQQEFAQYFHHVLDKICRKLNVHASRLFACRDLVGDLLAAHMASIMPTHSTTAPYKFSGWSAFQSQNENYERNRSMKKRKYLNNVGPKRSVNRASYRSDMQNTLQQDESSNDTGLRISDAELLRLTLKHATNEHPADAFNRNTRTDSIAWSAADTIKARRDVNAKGSQKDELSSYKNRDILDEELVAAPASVLTPLLPPKNPAVSLDALVAENVTDIYSSQNLLNDFETLTIEGGKVEVVRTDKEKSAETHVKSEAAKEFKPLPGQVCCPKEEPKVKETSSEPPPPPPGPPPQICCPPKNQSSQPVPKTPPEKPLADNREIKASANPRPEIKPKARRIDTHSIKKKSELKKPPADDPNVFNCCLSIVGQRKVEINNCPMPVLSDDSVILKMHTCALGSSDMYLFDNGVDKETGPVVLGHEGSGIVYKVGKNVKHLRPGDAVAIEPGIACGVCPYCKSGRYNLCPAMKFNGLLQTYCSHPAHFCYKIPKDLDPTHAALTHPVAMALHACRKARVGVGSTVLVLGACPLGLSVVMAARAMGADKIIVIDTLEKNLKLAYELCADKTILATPEMTSEHLAEKVCTKMKANPNVVIDCCGCSRTVNLAGLTLKPGGFFVLAGCQTDCASLNILAMLAKEICACASFRTSNEFVNAMCLIGSRRANVAKLITHKTEFCEAQEGFEWAVDEEKSGAIKVLINWPHTEKR